MKNILSCLVGVLLLTSILVVALEVKSGQSLELPEIEWSRTYGGANDDNGAVFVIQTSDGGYTLAGSTNSFGSGQADFWLVKTDASGNPLWNKTFGGSSDDHVYSIVQASDGGYVMTGLTWSFGAGARDVWLVKTDANGNHLWNQTFGGANSDRGHCVIQANDGGYAVGGVTESSGAGGRNFWLIKTNSTGDMEWNRVYGGADEDFALSLIQTDDMGYAVLGYTRSFGVGIRDVWLVKTDLNGNQLWNKTYGGTSEEHPAEIVQTQGGGYIIASTTNSFGAGSWDMWLLETDANGNHLWNKTYGGASDDWARSLIQTDDSYVLAGLTSSFGAGMEDYWLVKTDVNGNCIWNSTYGSTNEDIGSSAIQTDDGGYALAGWTRSFGAAGADFWLIKLAAEEVSAIVDINPNTLNLWSYGEWITAYIKLPEGYDVSDVDVTTIKLNNTIAAEMDPTGIGDEDGDGIPDLMVKFDRAAVAAYIMANVDSALLVERRGVTITLTVTGNLNDGTAFEGSDTIKVMCRGGGGIGRHALIA